MARFLRFAIFTACFLFAGRAYAAGGSCNSIPVPAGVTHCFYIAANGSDSNSGTSESSPWLHAPGMPNCSATCASVTPTGGDGFILRGGDTWHFGNPAASPYVGAPAACIGASQKCVWLVHWTGSSGSPVYWGVDQTWFSGSSWTRPVMNGDNPPTTSGVSSCTYDESTVVLFAMHGSSGETRYNILDNLEFMGLCWSGTQQTPPGTAAYINTGEYSSGSSFNTVENVYIHGWSHKTFNCSAGPTGDCDGAYGIAGPSDHNLGHGNLYTHNVIDGSDTDAVSLLGQSWACFDVEFSVFRYVADGPVCNNNHVFHDNLIEYLTHSGDGQSHANGTEFNTEAPGTSNVFYNNVYRHLQPGGVGCGNVVVWRTPQTTDYAFNNLIYDQNGTCNNSNFWDLVTSNQGGADGWTDNEFNNTFQLSANGPFYNTTMNGTATVNFSNNHCIAPNGASMTSCQSIKGTMNSVTNINESIAAATTAGFTASQQFAYAPISQTSLTVGTGTSAQGYCDALTSSSDPLLQAAGNACQYDTGYACTYNANNHTVNCPGRATIARKPSSWSVGAYQGFQGPIAPYSLATAPH